MLTRTLRFVPVVLVFALAISAGCTGTQTSPTNATSTYTDLPVEEFKQMVDQFQGRSGEVTILDVRTDPEFQREHLRDAVNLDVSLGVFGDRVARFDRQKTYLVYCQIGTRSARAAQIMSDLGFAKVYNMRGGIAKWKDTGYPVVTGA
ncbi:MAG TPA: rhodanese-like domain-containing protein [Methanoregulaceae archaeon]|nr:rhodanese-like domain-containing protein [Methanoregulaceae archaeon]